jgi:hypothetical protein
MAVEGMALCGVVHLGVARLERTESSKTELLYEVFEVSLI